VRLLRRRPAPRAQTLRPAERYLGPGAEEARRLGHDYIGTEHLLLSITRDPAGGAAVVLGRLGVTAAAIRQGIFSKLDRSPPAAIDPEALATLGIDFEAVRERLEQTFGPGALERTRSACLSVSPRTKMALHFALDHAAGRPLRDEHVLLGLRCVPDSLAARILAELGVSLADMEAVLADGTDETAPPGPS